MPGEISIEKKITLQRFFLKFVDGIWNTPENLKRDFYDSYENLDMVDSGILFEK